MTPAELTNVVALPLSGVAWMGVKELTPAQLSAILAALATAGQTNHLQTGGATPTVAYNFGDGGSAAIPTGTDSAGQLSITTGGAGGTGQYATVTYAVPFGSMTSAPSVILCPSDDATAAYPFSVVSTDNGFSITIHGVTNFVQTLTYRWVAVGSPN